MDNNVHTLPGMESVMSSMKRIVELPGLASTRTISSMKADTVRTLISYVPQVLVHQILKNQKKWDPSKR